VGENAGMTMRGLLVLLAVLNLGVAGWWLLRTEPAPETVEETASGIARLQLVSERPDLQPTLPPLPAPGDLAAEDGAPAATAALPAATETAPAAETCLRIGPFADPAALAAAQAVLQPYARRMRVLEQPAGNGRGWRVYLPAAADRATADANAQRIRAAGFNDLLVVADGAEANSVALGRFSTEARARQHAEALRAAGFEARAEPVGEARTTRWIELAATGSLDPAILRRIAVPVERRTIECATR
jgi:cell division septation protein DedD